MLSKAIIVVVACVVTSVRRARVEEPDAITACDFLTKTCGETKDEKVCKLAEKVCSRKPEEEEEILAEVDSSTMLSLVNAERRKVGAAALTCNSMLNKAASNHATDMARNGCFSHVSCDGKTTLAMRLQAVGWTKGGGENIAKGQTSETQVMTSWMNSSGHKANILNTRYRAFGFARQLNIWVQVFGS
jgi:uncharacterized protein YkwD